MLNANGQLPAAPIASIARFAITDGLGAGGSATSSGLQTGQTVAGQYALGAAAFSGPNSFGPGQAALTTAASGGPPLGDTGLLVISDPRRNNPTMRAELQIAPDGRSAATVTVGGLYAPASSTTPVLNARLAGSVQPNTVAGPIGYAATLTSPGASFDGNGGLVRQADSQGVYANSVTGPSATTPVGTFAVASSGTAASVGAAPVTQGSAIGSTRLATNVSPAPTSAPMGRDALILKGYASAVVQSTAGGQNQVYAVSTGPAGVQINIPAASPNTDGGSALYATLGPFQPTAVGYHAADATPLAAPSGTAPPTAPLTFGRPTYALPSSGVPDTAVAGADTFAAVGNGAAMASVNQDMLTALADPARGGVPALAAMGPSDQHLAWGYFLGDLANQSNQASGNFVHLGFWVAGQQVPFGVLQQLSGTASYTGGMVGTLVDASAKTTTARVAAGTFTQTWNFAGQSTNGTLNAAAFDGAGWSNVNLNLSSSGTYVGAGASSTGPTRTLSIGGSFFNVPSGAVTLPARTGGTFAIRALDGTYGANGIFVSKPR